MRNKLNIGDEIIVRQGENVVGNGEKGKVTGMNIFQGEILYNIELERGFDNGGCLPIQSTQVREGEYEQITGEVDVTKDEAKKVRAKFKVSSKTEFESGKKVELYAVHSGSKENEEFFKYTPSARIELQTINEEAANKFNVGKEYYVDFSAAE